MIMRRTRRAGRPVRRKRARDTVRIALSLGMLVGFGAVGTMAAFSDDVAASPHIQTGEVNLRLNDQDTTTSSRYQFQQLTATPLDSNSVSYAPLKVSNTGTLAVTYDMSVGAISETGAINANQQLRQYVLVTVATGVSSCDATGWDAGTVIAPEGPLPDVSLTGRALAANDSETLCFMAQLDQSPAQYSIYTGSAGITLSVNLDFIATQS